MLSLPTLHFCSLSPKHCCDNMSGPLLVTYVCKVFQSIFKTCLRRWNQDLGRWVLYPKLRKIRQENVVLWAFLFRNLMPANLGNVSGLSSKMFHRAENPGWWCSSCLILLTQNILYQHARCPKEAGKSGTQGTGASFEEWTWKKSNKRRRP